MFPRWLRVVYRASREALPSWNGLRRIEARTRRDRLYTGGTLKRPASRLDRSPDSKSASIAHSTKLVFQKEPVIEFIVCCRMDVLSTEMHGTCDLFVEVAAVASVYRPLKLGRISLIPRMPGERDSDRMCYTAFVGVLVRHSAFSLIQPPRQRNIK